MRLVNQLVIVVGALMLVAGAMAGGECCEKAAATNDWCKGCKEGFYNGVSMSSAKLHKTLAGDPVSTNMKCEGCKAASANDGWCKDCGTGYANKRHYASWVGYRLALGKHTAAKEIKCDACKKASADHGWCDACKAGMVGCERYTDKAQYEAAVAARPVLVAAAKEKCEGCAVAMVTNGKCEACKVSYKDGKKSGS
ncbi:MAG: hypothetical protein JNG88_13140 [Phycisphaerales bacterium]|nr:hypothetical protein [Phycisphaerales bacterium]